MNKLQSERYVHYNDRIKYMLLFVDEMVNIIYRDFERNGGVHPNYILEKLLRAENDLQVLINIAMEKQKENGENNEYV